MTSTVQQSQTFAALAPLVAVVFLGFLSIGAPLPVLSLQVGGVLGFGAVAIGWAVGMQSVATVLTRHGAGLVCDRRGPRRAVLLGLPLASAAGVFYGASAMLPLSPPASLATLLVGRVLLGLGESLFMTGAMNWGIARLGVARTGTVMSWQGLAMYAALGAGAPAGLLVHEASGFTGVAVLTVLAPLAAFVVAAVLPGTPALLLAPKSGQVGYFRVVGLIWRPGLVLALGTVPFAAIETFLVLDFTQRGWSGAGLAFTGFAAGYIAVRLAGSHLPDRLGGTMAAAGSLVVTALGQALLFAAPVSGLAIVGAVVSGAGFSLVFPSMGILATRGVPAALRGRAVGNFTAFFDVAVGATGPLVGIVTARFGGAAAFAVGVLAALAGLAVLAAARRRADVPAT